MVILMTSLKTPHKGIPAQILIFELLFREFLYKIWEMKKSGVNEIWIMQQTGVISPGLHYI